MRFCNSPPMNTVEAYLRFTPGLITNAGQVTIGTPAGFLRNYTAEFHTFIARVAMRSAAWGHAMNAARRER